ncbi:farnesol dehydrogenase [Linepithema humile]|uniref:farnesol dehydrogenase n=1 Tax=Linepithema humile TaxID=83485 RepID=UPI0006231D9D|nr:PREDICTED: farnesol dehydrogenase-like [Linepithema humile]XP_012234900.1 PREDICTED: farnesol dehydrogenase-like [Linepithema humile]
MNRWLGKTAVVTGAGSGMGEAITCALLRNGVNVGALDIRKERLTELDEKCKRNRTSGKLFPICCDVTVECEINKAFSTIETLGNVDIMVNCAGIIDYSRIIESDRKMFEKLLNTNVLAYAVTMNKAVSSMRKRNVEGHIFNITSVLAHLNPIQGMSDKDGCNGYNLYPASKYAARIMTTAVRREIAAVQAPIRVTNISPGAVRTNIIKDMEEFHDLFDRIRCIEPEDVANALVYVLGTRPEVQITELTIQPTLEII